MAFVRTTPKVVVRRISPNQSQRTQKIQLIVLHDVEGHDRPGISDLQGLAEWFSRPSTQASSHVATDGDGTSARFVRDDKKAWHCAGFNSASLGIEQMGFASDSRSTWLSRRNELRETARWIARWSHHYGIPIRKASVNPSNGTIYRSGVIRHMDLGSFGGGHHDPGENYPIGLVLLTAKYYLWLLKRGK